MDQNNQNQEEIKTSNPTKVTCPHCGKEFEAEVEVPSGENPPEFPKDATS